MVNIIDRQGRSNIWIVGIPDEENPKTINKENWNKSDLKVIQEDTNKINQHWDIF